MEYEVRATFDSSLDEMTKAYLECAEWCGLDEEQREDFNSASNPHWDISAQREAEADCKAFLADHSEDIGDRLSQAGHDFWLTRNRHGAGFWDGNWPELAGDRMTKDAHVYGSVNVWFDPETERLTFE